MSEGYRPQATVVTKTLIATFAAGLVIGILIGWGAANSRLEPAQNLAANGDQAPSLQSAPEAAPAVEDPAPAEDATSPEDASPDDTDVPSEEQRTVAPAQPDNAPAPGQIATPFDADVDGLWPAEQLMVGIDGLKADVLTLEWLNTFKPGAVVLGPDNVSDSLQLAALVLQIKQAVGLGTTLADPPLILYQDRSPGFPRLLAENPGIVLAADATDAQVDIAVRRATEARNQGIAAVVGPALDVPENSAQGIAEVEAATAKLARTSQRYMDGASNAGFIALAGTFPGEAISQGDGLNRHIPAEQMDLLAAAMQPFKLVMDGGIPGVLVGHVAVPGIDVDQPMRPASLSPKLLQVLIRDQWGYDGVLIASDITSHSMTRDFPREEIVLKALVSGCDAVILGTTNRADMRTVCDFFVRKSGRSDFPMDRIEASKTRLRAWRGRLQPAKTETPAITVAKNAPAPAEEVSTETPDMAPEEDAPAVSSAAPDESTNAEVAPVEPPVVEPLQESAPTPEPKSPENETPSSPDETTTPEPSPPMLDVSAPPTGEGKEDAQEEPVEISALAKDKDGETIATPEPTPIEPSVETSESPEAPQGAIPPNSTLIEHKIAQGDSLTRIAKRYGVSLSDLRAWNNLEDDTIKFGYSLKVYQPGAGNDSEASQGVPEAPANPNASAESAPDSDETPGNMAEPATPAPSPADPEEPAAVPEETTAETVLDAKPTPAPAPEGTKRQDHSVKGDETIETIAETYGVAVDDLLVWNGLTPNDLPLKPETLLAIHLPMAAEKVDTDSNVTPAADPGTKATKTVKDPAPGTYEIYEVSAGDNLRRIAARFGTTQQAIIELNGIERADHVEIGWKLKIPTSRESSAGAPAATEPEPIPADSTEATPDVVE